MITSLASVKDTRKPLVTIWGTSTETKPAPKYGSLLMANGSFYYEQDTCAMYRYDEEGQQWFKQENNIYPEDGRPSKTELVGLSTDEKPTVSYGNGIKIVDGAILYEIDTSSKYRYDKELEEWYKQEPISTGGSGGDGTGVKMAVVGERLIFS